MCVPLCSLPLSLSLTHSLSLSLTLSLSHTHTHSLSLSHTHTHTLSLPPLFLTRLLHTLPQVRREAVVRFLKYHEALPEWVYLVAACLHPEPLLRPTPLEMQEMMQDLWEVEGDPLTAAQLLAVAQQEVDEFQQRKADGWRGWEALGQCRQSGPLLWLYAAECLLVD
jgi:hypothetical protein